MSKPTATSLSNTQIEFLKYHFSLKEIGALVGETTNCRYEQESFKMILKHLVIPDSKKTLKDH
jgi:hypothetical protein